MTGVGSAGGRGDGGLAGMADAGAAGDRGEAGVAGTTGAGGAAGMAEAGATDAGGGDGPEISCSFVVTSTPSTVIPTVGIVTWSTDLPDPIEAHIDFGLTTAYGMTAPVNLAATDYRTLLLGMKAARTYHFRVEASTSGGRCLSQDYTIATGPLASGLPTVTSMTITASAAFGGFLMTGQYKPYPGPEGAYAYILDADADIVWWYNVSGDASGVRTSYDGDYVWINSVNFPAATASVHRVSMDGLTDDDFSSQFTGQNHQLTVLPDETVAFYAYGSNGCDDIKQRSPDGTVTTIVNAQVAHGGTGGCHVNAIEYSAQDDTLVFSDLTNDDLTKITRTGTTVWVLNGTGNTFSGDSWKGGQHGIDILGLDDFVIFNNNNTAEGGTGTGSIAIEMKLDLAAMTAAEIWSFAASPGLVNDVMGDVQRLPNGNTVVAYSTKGTLDEVDPGATLVQSWSWPAGTLFGYIEKRATLYGPPPR